MKIAWLIQITSLCVLLGSQVSAVTFNYGKDYPGPPVRILGDMNYPPFEWLEEDAARGIYPSLLPILADALQRPIEYELMPWKEAQEQVKQGSADALTIFSPNPSRIDQYDFAEGFIDIEMGLFVREGDILIHNVSDLTGKPVGVTEAGFLWQFLSENSNATLVPIEDDLDGFEKLLDGTIDAVATSKWGGGYTVASNGLLHIKLLTRPIMVKETHIGIGKGNDALLAALNEAVPRAKQDPRYQEILQEWNNEEIVFLTVSSIRKLYVNIALVIVGLITTMLVAYIVLLRIQVRQKTQHLEAANTELEAALNDLTEMQEQLVQTEKVASLGALIAGLSHEFNTPLGSAITMSSQLDEWLKVLESNSAAGSEQSELVRDMKEASTIQLDQLKRLAQLLKSLKVLAVDRQQLQPIQCDLADIIDDSLQKVSGELESRNVKVVRDYPSALSLRSHPTILREVFDQLIENALRHGFKGAASPEISIVARIKDNRCDIRFSDNGSGVNNADIKRFFDPFFTTSMGQGTSGLGLNAVYNFIHGILSGHIRINISHGTCFEIDFPID